MSVIAHRRTLLAGAAAEAAVKGEYMTDCNTSYTGTYTTAGNTGTYHIYYGDPWYWGDPYYRTNEPYRTGRAYPRQEPSPVTVIERIVKAPAPEQTNRKENSMAISRQTFLDALADEGKPADSEGREIVKEAKADKWELFIARLLARVFESADLAVLKEKPKEVLIKEA